MIGALEGAVARLAAVSPSPIAPDTRIEPKNWTHVAKLVDYERYASAVYPQVDMPGHG